MQNNTFQNPHIHSHILPNQHINTPTHYKTHKYTYLQNIKPTHTQTNTYTQLHIRSLLHTQITN